MTCWEYLMRKMNMFCIICGKGGISFEDWKKQKHRCKECHEKKRIKRRINMEICDICGKDVGRTLRQLVVLNDNDPYIKLVLCKRCREQLMNKFYDAVDELRTPLNIFIERDGTLYK